jgi:hypothetical protein
MSDVLSIPALKNIRVRRNWEALECHEGKNLQASITSSI